MLYDGGLIAGSSYQQGRLIAERSGLDKAAVMVLSPQDVRNRLLTRPILFLLGAEATQRQRAMLDRSCSADFQGRNRYERGILYRHHLQFYRQAMDPGIHQWLVIPDAGNDLTDMFIDPLVSAAIMGIR